MSNINIIPRVNTKRIYGIAACIVVVLLVYFSTRTVPGSDEDAISEAKEYFKADMEREISKEKLGSIKFREVLAERSRNGDLYRISGEAVVLAKRSWTTDTNGKNGVYKDVKLEYTFGYHLNYYGGEWALEYSNSDYIGKVK